jgi:hypothetical protein
VGISYSTPPDLAHLKGSKNTSTSIKTIFIISDLRKMHVSKVKISLLQAMEAHRVARG